VQDIRKPRYPALINIGKLPRLEFKGACTFFIIIFAVYKKLIGISNQVNWLSEFYYKLFL
jgi:hypothetical protein